MHTALWIEGAVSIALTLLPDFALILLGAALRRLLHLGDHFWSGVEKLVYFVLFPALLFNGLVRTRIDPVAVGALLAVTGAALACGMLLAHGARFGGISTRSFASQYQCAFRFNSYIGLAVAGSLHGMAGIAAMAVVVGVMVIPANFAAVWMLARYGEVSVWRELLRNPLILATLAGLGVNFAGLQPPALALQFLGRLAEASIALGLLAVGAGLRSLPGDARTDAKLGAGEAAQGFVSAYLLGIKLALMPLFAWWLARRLELPAVQADIALVFAGLPTASSAYILAQRMGGDGQRVAWLISASTLLAMLTLPMWLVRA